MTKYVMVDVEANGPIPGEFSMTELGAVVVECTPQRTFHAILQPISDKYVPEAIQISHYTMAQLRERGETPETAMLRFLLWLQEIDSDVRFISDNNGFDWQFVNWYFWMYLKKNPFGYSSTNLGSLYKGLVHNLKKNFKHLRVTKHSHNPVDDAMGNVEALITLDLRYNLGILGGK